MEAAIYYGFLIESVIGPLMKWLVNYVYTTWNLNTCQQVHPISYVIGDNFCDKMLISDGNKFQTLPQDSCNC